MAGPTGDSGASPGWSMVAIADEGPRVSNPTRRSKLSITPDRVSRHVCGRLRKTGISLHAQAWQAERPRSPTDEHGAPSQGPTKWTSRTRPSIRGPRTASIRRSSGPGSRREENSGDGQSIFPSSSGAVIIGFRTDDVCGDGLFRTLGIGILFPFILRTGAIPRHHGEQTVSPAGDW